MSSKTEDILESAEFYQLSQFEDIKNFIKKHFIPKQSNQDKNKVSKEERNFRWTYSLLIELAKEELSKANEECGKDEWPAGQEWHHLVPTSHSIFLRRARERAGIDHDEFLAPIRNLEYDIADIYDKHLENK